MEEEGDEGDEGDERIKGQEARGEARGIYFHLSHYHTVTPAHKPLRVSLAIRVTCRRADIILSVLDRSSLVARSSLIARRSSLVARRSLAARRFSSEQRCHRVRSKAPRPPRPPSPPSSLRPSAPPPRHSPMPPVPDPHPPRNLLRCRPPVSNGSMQWMQCRSCMMHPAPPPRHCHKRGSRTPRCSSSRLLRGRNS